jgi:pimeloyl-ACP methyl ester carboxylesterase
MKWSGRSKNMRIALVFALLVPMTAVISLPTGTAGARILQPVGDYESAPCPFVLPDGLVEGDDVECGYLIVPERHELPDGPTIRLAVATLNRTGASESGPPLILLNGGPGQGSDGLFSLFAPGENGTLAALREGRDVVLFDQRGTGRSEPALLCTGDTVEPFDPAAALPTPDDAVEAPEDIDEMIGFYDECLAGWERDGVDLGAYTTAQNAADVAALRTARGYDEVDLLGISYGTRLALTVMRDHPEGIRSVVMGSVLPLEVDLYAGQVVAFDAVLRKIFAGCQDDPACASILPDPEQTLEQLVATLDASPMTVSYEPLAGGDPIAVDVDGSAFLSMLYVAAFVGPLVGAIPALIALTASGAPDGLAVLLPISDLLSMGVASGMLLAVNCQDEAPFSSMANVEAAAEAAEVLAPLRTDAFYQTSGASLQLVCAPLDLASSPAVENEPVTSDIPALLVSGEYDPITPPAYGETVSTFLSNSVHVVLSGVSHDPISSSPDCAVTIVVEFLADPAGRVDTSCADDVVVDFSPGF